MAGGAAGTEPIKQHGVKASSTLAQNSDYKNSMFDKIARVYGLFYARQKKRFNEVLDGAAGEELPQGCRILDVGCGTGALCDVLAGRGFAVTGVDPAKKMLRIAKKRNAGNGAKFVCASALETLPFDDNVFDVSIASYVAHGIGAQERAKMYAQMSRVTSGKIIIYDYNEKRALLSTIIEKMEGGTYFGFIKTALSEMRQQFGEVRVIEAGPRAAWYIMKPGG